MSEWSGDTPFYVLIVAKNPEGDRYLTLDLDEQGWATKYATWLRIPSRWHLIAKGNNRVVLSVLVNEGDQPYYTKRTVGAVGSGGSAETSAFGIGKKQADGQMVRLWAMSNGVIVGGEDVDQFGIDLVRELGPSRVSE